MIDNKNTLWLTAGASLDLPPPITYKRKLRRRSFLTLYFWLWLGGKIQTEQIDGFVIEKGPDSFLASKPSIMDLSIKLGLQYEMVGLIAYSRETSSYKGM